MQKLSFHLRIKLPLRQTHMDRSFLSSSSAFCREVLSHASWAVRASLSASFSPFASLSNPPSVAAAAGCSFSSFTSFASVAPLASIASLFPRSNASISSNASFPPVPPTTAFAS